MSTFETFNEKIYRQTSHLNVFELPMCNKTSVRLATRYIAIDLLVAISSRLSRSLTELASLEATLSKCTPSPLQITHLYKRPGPLTSKTFSSMPTHIMNICGEFH